MQALSEIGRVRPLLLPSGVDTAPPTTDTAAPTATAAVAPAAGVGDATGAVPPSVSSKAALVQFLLGIASRAAATGPAARAGERDGAVSARTQEAALGALGAMCVGDFPHPCFAALLSGLCATGEKLTSPELHMSVGVALTLVAAGPRSAAIYDEFHPPPAAEQPAPPAAAAGPNPVLAAAESRRAGLSGTANAVADPVRADANATVQVTVAAATEGGAAAVMEETSTVDMPCPTLTAVLDEILGAWVRRPLARARQAAGVWLLCLVKHCAARPELRARVAALQSAFVELLSEGDEFTQVLFCVRV